LELVKLVRKHYAANGLAVPPDLVAQIMDADCKRVPPDYCESYDEKGEVVSEFPASRPSLNWREIYAGTKTIVGWLSNGGKKEDAEEIKRRIAICVECRFNVPFDCASCGSKTLHDLLAKVVANEKYDGDEKLLGCYWCGCSNQAQVRLPLVHLHKFLSDDINNKLPDHCWKKKPIL
jgi:hypothetical protein